MGNIEFFKKELTKSFKNHLEREAPKMLDFIRDELNILLDRKINELRKINDNTVKPQYVDRKSENPNSTKRIRKYSLYPM
jgi:hypothetical protein